MTIVVRRPKIFYKSGSFRPFFALSEALICKSRFNHLKRLAQLEYNASLTKRDGLALPLLGRVLIIEPVTEDLRQRGVSKLPGAAAGPYTPKSRRHPR